MQHHLITAGAALREPATRPVLHAADEHRLATRSRGSGAPLLPDARTWAGLFGAPALSVEEQAALAALARTRTVAAGAMVFQRGDTATALVLAHSGDVALGYCGADGVFRIERPVRGPAWLDQSAAWLQEHHAMDARASSETLVIELPVDAVQAQLAQHPGLARQLVTSLAREVQSLSMNTHELMHKDAPARFAAWLVQRLDSVGDSQGLLRLGERKRDIASQLAVTPETLSRLMRSLTHQGLISVAGYSVQVLDAAALRRVAAGL
jgi:CRP/FNR family transcriptional regulator, dissimilatory nitrate respiration regulator